MGDNPIEVGSPDGNDNVETVFTPQGVEQLRSGQAGLDSDSPGMNHVTGEFGRWAIDLQECIGTDNERVRKIRLKVYQGPDFRDGNRVMLVFRCKNLPMMVTDAINRGNVYVDTMHGNGAHSDEFTVSIRPNPDV